MRQSKEGTVENRKRKGKAKRKSVKRWKGHNRRLDLCDEQKIINVAKYLMPDESGLM